MDIQRIQAKVQVLGLLPEPILNGTVAEAALRRCMDLLNVSISSNAPSEDDERRRILSVVRDVLRTVPLPPTTEGLGDGTANELLQAVQNLINATPAWEVREEAVLLLIDLQRTGLQTDRNAVVNRLNESFDSAPIDAVPMLVAYLKGPALEEFPECAERLLQRASQDQALVGTITAEAAVEQRMGWLRSVFPRNPVLVLNARDAMSLSDQDWMEFAEVVIGHASSMNPVEQAALLAEVATFPQPAILADIDAYTEGLARLLTSGDESTASKGQALLQSTVSVMDDPGRVRLLASRLHDWLQSIGDKYQPSPLAALMLVRAQLTKEEKDALIGMLFDRSVRDESRPHVVEHALGVLGTLEVRYDAVRGPNFEALKLKFQTSGDPAMKDAILRGLERIKHGGAKGAKDFWEWASSAG